MSESWGEVRVRPPNDWVQWDIQGYRESVEELCRTLPEHDAGSGCEVVQDGCRTSPIAEVLIAANLPADFVDDLSQRVHDFVPTAVASARGRRAFLRVQLLSLVDVVWWAGHPVFETDEQVRTHPDLVDLRAARKRGELEFSFRTQVNDIPRRAFRAADRRLFPARVPNTSGMRLPFGRPEVIAVLNDLARELRQHCESTPTIWVNSLVRSSEYQRDLRTRGYLAAEQSAHCSGWAADIEMDWMRARGWRDELAAVLQSRAESGELSVIDEGQAWHVCLSPAAARRLREGGV